MRCLAQSLKPQWKGKGQAKEAMIYNCYSYIGKLEPQPQRQGWIPTVRGYGYSSKLELGRHVMPVLTQAITHGVGNKGGPQAGLELGGIVRMIDNGRDAAPSRA